ncbi:hypothetical protein [Desulfoferula mesophila]|uniref:Uncharacterized protein n=1 Tax=Desulfoferula mesophila TaxID=3058419 RepID=A0AAU9EQ65_9BACT|nr:hypothetical protein FAK_30670 [Desulfoferula mesophilus]
MNDYFEKWQIFQAWELAWQMRFCPPLEEVIGQELTPEAAAHLEACLLCQRRRTAEIIEPPWQQLAPEPWHGHHETSDESPEPGQVWRLDPALAGWGPKHRYYRPPLVLVLDTGPNLANAVLVAQTHYDPTFASSQDVLLDESRFAQPWNVYTLHRRNLFELCAPSNPAAAALVREASQKPFPHLAPWSLGHVFQQMEIELGCYFSFSAAQQLMAEYEAAVEDRQVMDAPQGAEKPEAAPRTASDIVDETEAPTRLIEDLRDLGLKVELPLAAGLTPADLYFHASPGEQHLLKAAATADKGWRVPVLAFQIRRGRPVACHFLQAHVTDFLSQPKVAVGGRILGPLPEGEHWQAEFRWLDAQGKLLKSLNGHLGPTDTESIRFWAVFPEGESEGQPELHRRLYARLFSKQR